MDIKIINDKNNALLNRRELDLKVTFDGATPSRNDVRSKLAAMLTVPMGLVIVQKMDNEFGKQELKGYVKIYEDEARMKQVEETYVLERNKMPEPEVAEEEPAEE
ncbi:30S ribosomal protein S24e [Methanolobus mangrovi]|uniref:Small ribosomal subunit protein eS24 n=1 Tax=Methanolobus mangrovi TaxID=3072977 RepID=A0AA51YFN8_9EURY|nr:30S ribosomal protein S24e [Methanolobus mangrovi]WMW21077.1 30S ribosomal protein S24e [Methanolobus mangrovi]